MEDDISLLDYLARGGKLTSPDNAPARYRAELLRIMASFIDSEMAGASGFADVINKAPGLTERIAAARIVLEKFDHAREVLSVMETFGADGGRYQSVHPWTARVARDASLGSERRDGDMRLNVFWYPIAGWTDAVVLNVLMGYATVVQLEELSQMSYQPLGEAFARILERERRHAELGAEGLERIARDEAGRHAIVESIEYWRAKVAETFGASQSDRWDLLKRFGLRKTENDSLRARWDRAAQNIVAKAIRSHD